MSNYNQEITIQCNNIGNLQYDVTDVDQRGP